MEINNQTGEKKIDKHKLWLVLGITIVVLALVILVLYSSPKTLAGKAMESSLARSSDLPVAAGTKEASIAGEKSNDLTKDIVAKITSLKSELETAKKELGSEKGKKAELEKEVQRLQGKEAVTKKEKKGDIDCDGQVTLDDAIFIARVKLGILKQEIKDCEAMG